MSTSTRAQGTDPRRIQIWPNGDFELTRGKLLTLSKPNPYPKSVRTPAHKLRKMPSLCKPFGRFDEERL